jgi:hypothetical protein
MLAPQTVWVWKGKPAIMDFKQSNKVKKREYIDDYFVQLAAYAEAHNDTHGTRHQHWCNFDGCTAKIARRWHLYHPAILEFVIEGDEFEHWRQEWLKRVELYYLMS